MQRTWKVAREPLQPRADDVGDAPADAGVDLVEDERLARCVGRRQRLQRQHDARELPARRDPRERPQNPRPGSARCRTPPLRVPRSDHCDSRLAPARTGRRTASWRIARSRERLSRAPGEHVGRGGPPAGRERGGAPGMARARRPARHRARRPARSRARGRAVRARRSRRAWRGPRPARAHASASDVRAAPDDPRPPADAPETRRCSRHIDAGRTRDPRAAT